MIFGRCFEKALEGLLLTVGDCGGHLHREWGRFFSDNSWFESKRRDLDRPGPPGVPSSESRFAQDKSGFTFPQPQQNLQIKVLRELPNAVQFVAYVLMPSVNLMANVISNGPGRPPVAGIPKTCQALPVTRPSVICYSWMTGFRCGPWCLSYGKASARKIRT